MNHKLAPTHVVLDREPNRWGVGGPNIPAHGTIVASPAARAILEAKPAVFDVCDLDITVDTKSEMDEGDGDFYQTSTLTFRGEAVWSLSTSSHANIGGAWGTDSSVRVEPKTLTLVVSLTHCGRTVGGGHDAHEERCYALRDVLIGAALKDGAKLPRDPDAVKLDYPLGLDAGTTVVLVGLKKMSQLNGTCGTVVCEAPGRLGRWHVCCASDGVTRAFTRANMDVPEVAVPVAEAPEEGEGGGTAAALGSCAAATAALPVVVGETPSTIC